METQERAQRNMTGPSKFQFDERNDVWALGCLFYGMPFGKSPFDCGGNGSAALAVLGGTIKFPENHPLSDSFCALFLLSVDLRTVVASCVVRKVFERISIGGKMASLSEGN